MFRNKANKTTPEISTASLPDIIFMLLFFFMVVTVMRENEQKVTVNYTAVSELTKLEKRSLVANIFVGPPTEAYKEKWGTAPIIQLEDQFASKEDIIPWVRNKRNDIVERDKNKFTVSLKVDAATKMGILSEVKQQLRKAQALKVNYSAVPRIDD